MDTSKSLVVWIAGFAGVMLMYSAYKGKAPVALLSSTVGNAAAANPPAGPASPGSYDRNGNTTTHPAYASSNNGYKSGVYEQKASL
jgi:hypothetical protein